MAIYESTVAIIATHIWYLFIITELMIAVLQMTNDRSVSVIVSHVG